MRIFSFVGRYEYGWSYVVWSNAAISLWKSVLNCDEGRSTRDDYASISEDVIDVIVLLGIRMFAPELLRIKPECGSR